MDIKKIFLSLLVTAVILFTPKTAFARANFFDVQSIDTMKYSRDEARGKAKDPKFNAEIDIQIKNIAQTGATHVAIGTPYDEEFIPFLTKWVGAARKYKLKVWFRGNFSGWEGWFGYPAMSKDEHILKTEAFIHNHQDLFKDGDIFTSCPECENGSIGDPRLTGEVEEYKDFLKKEYQTAKSAFQDIDKKVTANYYSMNGDVAKLIMDEEMTKSLDGVVTIDHYVESVDRLVSDIRAIAAHSKGKVMLGEFGAPIPDLHGPLSDHDQNKWIEEAMSELIKIQSLIGVNYWTSVGGTTELWNFNYTPRPSVATIRKYFIPLNVYGKITDLFGKPLKEITVKGEEKVTIVSDGNYSLPIVEGESVTFSKYGYISMNIRVDKEKDGDVERNIILVKSYTTPIYNFFTKLFEFFKSLFK